MSFKDLFSSRLFYRYLNKWKCEGATHIDKGGKGGVTHRAIFVWPIRDVFLELVKV